MDELNPTDARLPAAREAERRAGWSALFDGECAGEDLDALLDEAQARRRDAVWDTYRCIGDALRAQEDAQPAAADPAFVRAVMARVQAEPHVAVPPARLARHAGLPPAANAALWRWRAVAGVAAVAAVAALLWPALQPHGAGTPLAAAPATPVSGTAGSGARDTQLEEFVAAHRAWGHASALQAPAGFLRTVAYEAPGR